MNKPCGCRNDDYDYECYEEKEPMCSNKDCPLNNHFASEGEIAEIICASFADMIRRIKELEMENESFRNQLQDANKRMKLIRKLALGDVINL
jgi:hypothetical protein